MITTRLTQKELLVLICEEAAEVIQAATKCLRFGYDTIGPGDHGMNSEVLAREAGQLFACVSAAGLMHRDSFYDAHHEKIAKAEAAKSSFGGQPMI